MTNIIFGIVIIVALYFLLEPNQKSVNHKRIQSIAASNDTDSGGGGLSSFFAKLVKPDENSRRKQIEESISKMDADYKSKVKKRKSISAKLIQADWSISPQIFIIIATVLGLIVGGLFILLGLSLPFTAGIAFVAGYGMPRFILNFVIARRQKKFAAAFPDALDIVVRGVKTGLPLGDCLKIIAHESPDPLGAEFRRLMEGEAVGVPIEVGLEHLYDRMPAAEVSFFATVLNIQRTTGGNLAESLANLSGVLRGRKMLREKIKALSAEAKMSAIIIGALPVVVAALVSVMAPDYMEPMFTTERGKSNLMISGVMMVIGIFSMRKMINFKF